MSPEDYERLQALVSLPYGACPSATALRREFPTVKPETWLCIFGQEQQYKVIKSHHLHRASVFDYLTRYTAGEDVLQLSADVDFPPCMLFRRILEKLIDAPKQAVGEVLRNPDRLDAALCPGVPPDLLARMREDVVRCVHADSCYSPLSDVAKQVTGLEYELYLQQRLAEAGVPFWSEGELRQLGFHKTPDCKLKVPIAVRGRTGCEHIVCWVDSKATFGDHRTHVKQVEEQYCTYVNRYGPGMVIYWFGFVDDLNTDPQVLLCDDFPDAASIVKLAGTAGEQQQQQQQQQPAAGGAGAGAIGGLQQRPAGTAGGAAGGAALPRAAITSKLVVDTVGAQQEQQQQLGAAAGGGGGGGAGASVEVVGAREASGAGVAHLGG
ncbi:hypothetical protein TSOC_000386 [Tetrabaena socialis]|uniref:CDAN1-interacting nuclease 1 n=1 Tax=Tetrabaena socialis TaxID=47790 RepID=A0A2J8AJJ0_9CHLO|nr:hypothetical protein TSOC_000386 [Tetrabaena socialis]|eukprot:PNH12687.1 hypothetical protein TSOC_000386 [Tetrabaena socialis]